MRKIILGAGGHGKVVLEILLSYLSSEEIAGYADDSLPKGTSVAGYPVVETIDRVLSNYAPSEYIIALGIGDAINRRKSYERAKGRGFSVITPVHARSVISPSARMGEGTVVMAGAVVNADAEIGIGAIINTGATVDHDCFIENWVHISPGANLAGGVRINENSHIGIGACVVGGLTIGSNCRIGAGAAVTRNVADGLTVVGIPARPSGEGQ